LTHAPIELTSCVRCETWHLSLPDGSQKLTPKRIFSGSFSADVTAASEYEQRLRIEIREHVS